MGMEQTSSKSQYTKVNSGEENSPAAPAGIWTNNLSIMSQALLVTSYPGWLGFKFQELTNRSKGCLLCKPTMSSAVHTGPALQVKVWVILKDTWFNDQTYL